MSEHPDVPLRLRQGDRFVAKWSGKTITVERCLGEGANGSVYLARCSGGPSHCALKVGNDAYGLQSEINALQRIGNVAPKLLLSDDGERNGVQFPFYLMSLVPGVPLGKLALDPAGGGFYGCGASLLQQLRELHRRGWTFGDLKPDNVMIGKDGAARLVDYGGATPFGQAVRQFTELYDRGYWKAGGRKAEAAYDLFSFAVVMLEAAGLRGRLRAAARQGRDLSVLLRLVDDSGMPARTAAVLKRLLRSELADSDEAYRAWLDAMGRRSARPASSASRWPAVWFVAALVSFLGILWRLAGM